jgi:hypothetical protein
MHGSKTKPLIGFSGVSLDDMPGDGEERAGIRFPEKMHCGKSLYNGSLPLITAVPDHRSGWC